MDIQDFPFLNQEEFAEACHHLDSQYCQATLGPVRKTWKLYVCTALDTIFSFSDQPAAYIQIIRPLEPTVDPEDLSLDLSNFSFSEEGKDSPVLMTDNDMIDAEDSDSAVIMKQPSLTDVGHVIYEIHLHPTYRIPCLWFTLRGLPADEPAFNIDTVFRRLVPDEYKDSLRKVGGIGGISADHHPVTGVPSFFIHPCLLGDAISSFECSRQNYLMIWLGLVGGCVGLWVPKEMAFQ